MPPLPIPWTSMTYSLNITTKSIPKEPTPHGPRGVIFYIPGLPSQGFGGHLQILNALILPETEKSPRTLYHLLVKPSCLLPGNHKGLSPPP
ncbi:hypothetical protein GDO81_018458 [Engystomops pustulosus]|uniref:Uncharacterized protein n=1 Tax=Engystomops pustulosus TaxID=76066 RepID=A0AAV6ZRP6_ENGPU|nr:hypothetical protein GDO81_018458 [Engystomops pustulosus]